MYLNASHQHLLKLEDLGLSDVYIYPAFVFGTLTYLFIMFCNLLLITTIAWSKRLHKPMFILLFNLPISDMVGATAFFPQLIVSIVTQNRQISYPACVTQAFLVHVYGTGNLLFLSAMAYDRYVAICCPLRYNAIMTPMTLVILIFSMWIINLSLIVTLIALAARFRVCRTNVVDFFCNNPSLVKLVCEDTQVNNYYGLVTLVILHGGPLIIILFTYGQILRTCILTNSSETLRKATQTCSSHLTVYLLLEINVLVTLISHRVGNLSPLARRGLGVSVLVFPPLMNPIIYGLKTEELKQSIKMFLRRNELN